MLHLTPSKCRSIPVLTALVLALFSSIVRPALSFVGRPGTARVLAGRRSLMASPPSELLVPAGAPVKRLTLVFVRRVHEGRREILLGLKKRGFGKGKYNGFGGKVEPGETIEQAALRELQEESCLRAESVVKRGHLTFLMATPEVLKVHAFEAVNVTGEPRETEEMAPVWYPEDAIPYESMWADDIYWLPIFLKGQTFEGCFNFEEDEKTIIAYEVKEVAEITDCYYR